MLGKKKKEEEVTGIPAPAVASSNNGDNGHKQPDVVPAKAPEKTRPVARPISAETKWKAENWLFNTPNDDDLIMRTRLNLKEINLMASEVMHEEAINPYRNRITMPLSKVKRLHKMKGLLSLDGQSRDEAVGMGQAKAEEDAAKAAFD